MIESIGDVLTRNLRAAEEAAPATPSRRGRPAEEIRMYLREIRLTPARKAELGIEDEPEQRFTRDEGKIVMEPAAELPAAWSLRRRNIRCGKSNCTTCPHGPYLYVRIKLPGGAVGDVSLGREPGARHVFERLGDRLDGSAISEIVREIREGGR